MDKKKKAYDMREFGVSYKNIAGVLSVSKTTAINYVNDYKKIEPLVRYSAFFQQLRMIDIGAAIRTMSALKNHFQPPKHMEHNLYWMADAYILAIGPKKILSMSGIGHKTLKAISMALENMGAISDSRSWRLSIKK